MAFVAVAERFSATAATPDCPANDQLSDLNRVFPAAICAGLKRTSGSPSPLGGLPDVRLPGLRRLPTSAPQHKPRHNMSDTFSDFAWQGLLRKAHQTIF